MNRNKKMGQQQITKCHINLTRGSHFVEVSDKKKTSGKVVLTKSSTIFTIKLDPNGSHAFWSVGLGHLSLGLNLQFGSGTKRFYSTETQLGPTHQLPRPHIVRDTYNTHNGESLLPTYSGHQFGTVSERSVTVGTGVNPQPTRVVQKYSSHDERRRKQITTTPHCFVC